jgi:hypothetical protein
MGDCIGWMVLGRTMNRRWCSRRRDLPAGIGALTGFRIRPVSQGRNLRATAKKRPISTNNSNGNAFFFRRADKICSMVLWDEHHRPVRS